MKIEIITLTPERANLLLERNERNRKMSTVTAKEMARQITAGLWLENGSPIRMDSEGVLIDGQHRCYAVIESGISLPNVILVTDLDPAVMATIDTGKIRTHADILHMYDPDLTDVNSLAAITTALSRWGQGARKDSVTSWGKGRPNWPVDRQTMLRFFIDNRAEIVYLQKTSRRLRSSFPISGTVLAVAIGAFEKINRADAADFLEKLRTGAGLEMGDPIMALRKRLEVSRASRSDIIPNDVWLAMLFKAWNKYRAGEQMRIAMWRGGGANPEAFPEPV